MSLTTEQERDDLAARRRRKEARETAPRNDKASAPAQAARDLLDGLITGGPGQTAGTTGSPSRSNGGNELQTHAREEDAGAASRGATAPNKTAPEGEKIDQLIRRVRDSILTTDAEASQTLQQRRPTGTADLAPDAAVSRRRALRLHQLTNDAPPLETAPKRVNRRWGAAATILIVGAAVLAVALSSAGRHGAARVFDASASKTRLSAARPEAFGGALRATIAPIATELQALARRAAAKAHAARPRHKVKRPLARTHARVARPEHQTTTVVQSRAIASSSLPIAVPPETQSYTRAPTAAPSTSQTSATPATSTPSTSRPAGPTGSDPLGGIGSCVKGC